MTSDELFIITKLSACKFLPGTWAKRFVRDLSNASPEVKLSEKQVEWLYRLVYRMRKSLPHTYSQYKNNKYCKPVRKTKGV